MNWKNFWKPGQTKEIEYGEGALKKIISAEDFIRAEAVDETFGKQAYG